MSRWRATRSASSLGSLFNVGPEGKGQDHFIEGCSEVLSRSDVLFREITGKSVVCLIGRADDCVCLADSHCGFLIGGSWSGGRSSCSTQPSGCNSMVGRYAVWRTGKHP